MITCELCYTTVPYVTDGWDLILQSYVCPACLLKVKNRGLNVTKVIGGTFAENGKRDPRENASDYHRILKMQLDVCYSMCDRNDRQRAFSQIASMAADPRLAIEQLVNALHHGITHDVWPKELHAGK